MKKIIKCLVLALLCMGILVQEGAGLIDSKVFAQDDGGYYVYEEGDPNVYIFNKALDLVNFFDTHAPIIGKKYKLVLKEDLILPKYTENIAGEDITLLRRLNLKGDITIEGNNHIIKGEAGASRGDRLIYIDEPNPTSDVASVVRMNSLTIDGSNLVGGSENNNYAGVWVAGGNPPLEYHNYNSSCVPALDTARLELNKVNFINLYSDYVKGRAYGGTATSGGAAVFLKAARVIAKDTRFTNCESAGRGGAVSLSMRIYDCAYKIKSLDFDNCEFDHCKAGVLGGSIGVYSYELGPDIKFSLNISNCKFNACKAQEKFYFSKGSWLDRAGGGAIGLGAIEREKIELNVEKSIFTNCESDFTGGAIFMKNKAKFTLRDSVFSSCKAYYGGAVGSYSNYDKSANKEDILFEIDNCSFEACHAVSGGGALYLEWSPSSVSKYKNIGIIKNSKFTKNYAQKLDYHGGSGGAVYAQTQRLLIDNCAFEENTANIAGALICGSTEKDKKDNEPVLTIKNSKFISNKANRGDYPYVGALIIGINLREKLNYAIEDSEFINNYSKTYAGAILFSYSYDEDDYLRYQDINDVLSIRNTKFKGNFAEFGYFNPPKSAYNCHNFNQKDNSCSGLLLKFDEVSGKWQNIESLVNNYDIGYFRENVTNVYDSNGAPQDLVVEKSKISYINEEFAWYEVEPRDIKIKKVDDDEIKFKNGSKKFLGWSTNKNATVGEYKGGETIKNHRGNLYLYAIWEKPQEYTSLTLDENYRGGRVNDKDVMPGDMIEPHLYKPKRRGFTFKGWSYNRKHLDKVHYDDRIYEPTTIYAIWDEVEEEPEEIKGMTHKAYIFGYPDGTVRPNGEITRAEAAAMLARLLEIESIGSAEAPMFPDTPSAWYNKAINAVVQRGIMKGYPDGTFKPNEPITRAEFTQMISTIDNKPYGTAPFADVIGHWAERPIGSEYQAGRIAGYPDGTFRPDNHITRCEAAVILNKIFERNFDNMSLLKCKNPQMIKYFTDLYNDFWGYNEMVEATNTHEYIRRTKGRVEENWLLIK